MSSPGTPKTTSFEYGFQQSVEWLKQYNKDSKKSTKKKNKINPFFEECLVFVDSEDQRWINIFSDAVVGKFPRHFKYNKDTNSILYSYYKKKEAVRLDSSPLLAANQFISFIQECGRIYSKNDAKIIDSKNIEIKWEWGKIGGEKKKLELIGHYAISLCGKYQLIPQKYYSRIKHLINLNIILGEITNGDILMGPNGISEIKNIKWDSLQDKFILEASADCKRCTNKNKYHFVSNEYYLSEYIGLDDIYKSSISLKKRTTNFVQQFLSDKSTLNTTPEINIVDDVVSSIEVDSTRCTIDTTEGTADTIST